jgi:hypothetical protein
MVKDVRTMTGFLRRVDEERWEAVYEADGTLYMSETLASRELAERHRAKHRDLLEAGEQPNTSRFVPIASVERALLPRSKVAPRHARSTVQSHSSRQRDAAVLSANFQVAAGRRAR